MLLTWIGVGLVWIWRSSVYLFENTFKVGKYHNFFFFLNIQCQGSHKTQHTEHIKRGAGGWRDGRGKHKTVVNIYMRRYVEESRRSGVYGVNKMDTSGTFRSLHDRNFQEAKQGI